MSKKARTPGEGSDDEVVQGKCEGEKEAGEDSGDDLGNDDLVDGLCRGASQIHRCLEESRIHLLELGLDVEIDKGDGKDAVSGKERPEGEEGFAPEEVLPEEDEHDRQGHGKDDLGIDDGYLIDVLDKGTEAFPAIVDADGAEGPDDGRDKGGNGGKDEGIAKGGHDLGIPEEVGIELEGEALPLAGKLGRGEGIDNQVEDGKIKEKEDNVDIAIGQDFPYHDEDLLSPPSPWNLRVASMTRKMMISISRDMNEPPFQSELEKER